MGSGDRAYRIALGEAKAIQEHQLAMLPIMQAQTEMELEMQEKAAEIQLEMRAKSFEQEFEQAEKLSLLASQLQPEPEPILLPGPVGPAGVAGPPGPAGLVGEAGPTGLAGVIEPAKSKYLVYAGLAALVYFFLLR